MAEKRALSNSPHWDTENHQDTNASNEDVDVNNGNAKHLKPTRRILLSNIPYEVRDPELSEFLKEQVGEINFLQIFESHDGRSKGVGIVEFNTEENTKSCLEKLHRYNFKGRELVVKEDKEGDRDKHGEPINKSHEGSFDTYGIDSKTLESLNISGPLTNRLFIANIDYKVDERKIKEIFSLCGKINKVWLHKNDDNKPKGTGIIEMSHPLEAVQAIAMLNNQKLFNRELAIRIDKFAQDEDIRFRKFSAPTRVKLPSGLKSIRAGIDYEGAPLILSHILGGGLSDEPSKNLSLDMYSENSGMNGSSNNQMNALFNSMMGGGMGIGNANSNQQLMTLMNSLMGGSVGGAGGLGGSNFNQLMSSMMQGGAGGLGNMMMDPLMQQMMGGMSGFGSGGGGNSNSSFTGSTGGSGGGGGSSMGRSGTARLVVKNLPANYKWQDLKDIFREAGEVRYASVSPAKGESSTSEGLIEYNSMDTAKRAIKLLDNRRIGGRNVSVYFQ